MDKQQARKARYGNLVSGPRWRTTRDRLALIKKRAKDLRITQTKFIEYCIDNETGGKPVFAMRDFDGLKVATVTYDDGSMFTVNDWQGRQPASPEEIPDFTWYLVNPEMPEDTDQWTPAIILAGWPRSIM